MSNAASETIATPTHTSLSELNLWRGSPSFGSEIGSLSHRLPLPPVREQLHLIIDYFRHLYPIPTYAFLNEVSTTQRCLDGLLDETLLRALCAVTALQLKYAKYYPIFTASWIQQAEEMIWSQIELPTMFRTQALILITHYHIGTGNFQKAFMLSSLAARAAGALRLHYERTDLSPLAQEIRRRLMWSLMMLDGHFSVGLPGTETCSHDSIFVDLPCKEEFFNTDQDAHGNAITTSSLDGVSEEGLLSVIIRQAIIRRDAMKLKRQVCVLGQPWSQLEGLVTELSRTLQHTPTPTYSWEELQRYARSRWFARYLMAVLGCHQSFCDIYRLFLSGYKEAAPEAVISACSPDFVAQAIRGCLHHATCMMGVLKDLDGLKSGLLIAPLDIAICAYHACRLTMFFSRSALLPAESDLTPTSANTQVSMVLGLLGRLFADSVLMGHLIKDLDRLLQLHAANKLEDSRESSITADDAASHQPCFAITMKLHQTLGVHSILRRARFDEVADEPETGAPSRSSTSERLGPQSIGALSVDTHRLSETGFADLEGSAGEPFSSLGDALPFSDWESWKPWHWQLLNSDGDYF